jgi:hypothetical protein
MSLKFRRKNKGWAVKKNNSKKQHPATPIKTKSGNSATVFCFSEIVTIFRY